MVLLAIELAVLRLTPARAILPFLAGWCCGSPFAVLQVLVRSGMNTACRPCLQVSPTSRWVTLVVHFTVASDSSLNFLPAGHLGRLHASARAWGYLSAALAFILFGPSSN